MTTPSFLFKLSPMILANVALPSFIGHGIFFILLLPLVAAIEAIVLCRLLHLSYPQSFLTAGAANWRSTLAGLPAGWLMALAGLIPAGILVSFLPAAYREPGFQIIAFTALTGGIIPSAFTPIAMAAGNLIILFPYYYFSVKIERKIVETRHPEINRETVARAVRWMNRITYTILAALLLFFLSQALIEYKPAPPLTHQLQPN